VAAERELHAALEEAWDAADVPDSPRYPNLSY